MLMWNIVAAQVHWDGQAGDGLWGTAGNWTNNSVPLPSDDVVLDHSFVAGDYNRPIRPRHLIVVTSGI